MKAGTITTLIKKDLKQYARNVMLCVTSVVAFALLITVYYLIPHTLEERFVLGIHAAEIPEMISAYFNKENTKIEKFTSVESMKKKVADGEIRAGVVLSNQNLIDLFNGSETNILVYFPPNIPKELDEAFVNMLDISFNEITYFMQGFSSTITIHEEVLGLDMGGENTNPREKMIPFFVMFILMMDLMSLTTMLVEEKVNRTLHALLLTDVDIKTLFISKGISGTGIGFIQALLFLGITGCIVHNPLLLCIIVFLGALFITGLAFFVASVSKSMLSAVAISLFVMILLSFPGFAILFPGLISPFIKVIPLYHLVIPLYQVIHVNAGIASVWQSILVLSGSGFLMLWIGAFILRRKIR